MFRSSWARRAGAVLISTIAVGAFASPAQAAASGIAFVQQDSKIWYKAGWGKVNKVVVTQSGGTITIDDVVKVRAGTGCKAVKGDSTKVRCTPAKGAASIRVYLRDKSDTFVTKAKISVAVDGGTGKDHITGGPANDTVWAGGGADTVYGLGGTDFLYGDGYNAGENPGGKPAGDRLYGGPGGDIIFGMDGADLIRGNTGADDLNGGDGRDDCAPSKADVAALCEA